MNTAITSTGFAGCSVLAKAGSSSPRPIPGSDGPDDDIDPFPVLDSTDMGNLQNCSQITHKQYLSAAPYPMPVNHLGDLMSHLGIWVIALLGTQLWASWLLSAFAETSPEGGRPFYFAIAVFLILVLDSAAWFRLRGNLCNAFFVPGALLLLMSLPPILTLLVREILLAMC